MLGKVMKYEFKSYSRVLLPFFGLGIVIMAVLRFMRFAIPSIWSGARSAIEGFAIAFGVLVMVGVIFVSGIFMVVRFYQSFAGREASLSFTLPVSIDAHLIARLAVATVYAIIATIVFVICLLIFLPEFLPAMLNSPIYLQEAGGSAFFTLRSLPAGVFISGIGFIITFVIISCVTSLMQVYLSVAIGTQISRQRVVGSFVGYLIVNTAQSLLMLPIMALPLFNMLKNPDALMNYFGALTTGAPAQQAFGILNFMWAAAGLSALLGLLFAVIQYFLTRYIFTKRLNVE